MAGQRQHVSIGYDNQTAVKDNGILPSSALKGSLETADNAALALHLIKQGTDLFVEGKHVGKASHDIPEGHRFACAPIAKDEIIRSWGIPFGIALTDLAPGAYLCNLKSLATFSDRQSKLTLPAAPTFRNAPFKRHELPKSSFQPAPATADVAPELSPADQQLTFMGYPRAGGRGIGTRNYVVVMGVSSQAAGFVRALERRFKHTVIEARGQQGQAQCDGVVAVAHTEGGSLMDAKGKPRNYEKVQRVLAGFAVHPNVGALLLVDQGDEILTTKDVLAYASGHDYPLAHVPHATLSLGTVSFEDNLNRAATMVEDLLTKAPAPRQASPLSALAFAQQCGGSDAFSGISANPLAGWLARRLVCHGGSALLAETDELIGAEGYVLDKVRDYDTADHFLQLVDRFYRYTNRRGHSPEGNPSGGNLYRGLYNITLKSAGAAMKKLPEVRLDHVIEYGELLHRHGTGYAFMDSPGNDLESIAGQVAAGCNMIVFTTGNGSVTNFPFVPTIKVLTTSKRYELLSDDMDVNAGLFLDGKLTLAQLGEQTFKQFVGAASGQYTKGELAGHHQVQIWRNWDAIEGDEADMEGMRMDPSKEIGQESAAEQVTNKTGGGALRPDGDRDGKGIIPSAVEGQAVQELTASLEQLTMYPAKPLHMLRDDLDYVSEPVGLILPTSLCSGQIATLIAQRLNDKLAQDQTAFGVSRFVALPHTEGCGHSSGDHEGMVVRTMVGYASHPMAGKVVMLEHGCEKTHNGRFEQELAQVPNIDVSKYGFASVQLDGGLEKVSNKVEQIFRSQQNARPANLQEKSPSTSNSLRVGIVATTPLEGAMLSAVGLLSTAVAAAGGTVVLAGPHLKGGRIFHHLLSNADDGDRTTLGYGQSAREPGLHIMAATTRHPVELLTGLGATGVEVIVALVKGTQCLPAHPLVPVVQAAVVNPDLTQIALDIDLKLQPNDQLDESEQSAQWASAILQRVVACLNRERTPKLFGSEVVDFQLGRAAQSVSM
eukprot:TRINITY_DN10775_c0_g1_i2.p1 TRINITY_DN10775_c0_g1~~TRINITY_DN10775_c0_g1_i2.p1  ORF type:complete len:999 (+),score=247.95 TRINITY_DN10775_c0_g1_i2:14-3010(+)